MKRIVRLTERDLSRIVKRVLNEQVNQTIQIGASTIQNPKFNGDSVEFKAENMDKDTFQYIEPVVYAPHLTIRVNNLDETGDGKYTIYDVDDIELPNYEEELRYDSDEQQEMEDDMGDIKNRLFFYFNNQ